MAGLAKAVFFSYASDDAGAAQRFAAALKAAGIEVWLDQSELRGGDAWDASIRKQIRECALFVPLISAHTEARGEGYFRLEWKLAVERSRLLADHQPFLVPVALDNTPQASARVPDLFRERQWMLIGADAGVAAAVTRLMLLLSSGRATAATPGGVPAALTFNAAARRAASCTSCQTGDHLRPSLRQHERRRRAGVLFRRHQRGHHHRPQQSVGSLGRGTQHGVHV